MNELFDHQVAIQTIHESLIHHESRPPQRVTLTASLDSGVGHLDQAAHQIAKLLFSPLATRQAGHTPGIMCWSQVSPASLRHWTVRWSANLLITSLSFRFGKPDELCSPSFRATGTAIHDDTNRRHSYRLLRGFDMLRRSLAWLVCGTIIFCVQL